MRTSESHPIKIDFVDDALLPGGRLGVTFAPGKYQPHAMTGAWNRDVDADLRRIRSHYGTDILVGLIEDHEFEELEIADLPERAADILLEYRRHPVVDMSTPKDLTAFDELVDELLDRLESQQTVVVHCKGGLGRAGTLAAAILIRSGLEPDDALEAVRAAREGAVENATQERFLYQLAAR